MFPISFLCTMLSLKTYPYMWNFYTSHKIWRPLCIALFWFGYINSSKQIYVMHLSIFFRASWMASIALETFLNETRDWIKSKQKSVRISIWTRSPPPFGVDLILKTSSFIFMTYCFSMSSRKWNRIIFFHYYRAVYDLRRLCGALGPKLVFGCQP